MMLETKVATKKRGETTSEFLIKSGLSDTRQNRILCNFSGLLCWAFLFCWFPLLIGQPHRSLLLALIEIPLIFVVPGLFYLLTIRLWPAFALIQMQFIKLIAMLSILWLPMGLLIGVMNNQTPVQSQPPLPASVETGASQPGESRPDFWFISGSGIAFLIYLFIIASIVRLSRLSKDLTAEQRKKAFTHLMIITTILTWASFGILCLTAHYGRDLKYLLPSLTNPRVAGRK